MTDGEVIAGATIKVKGTEYNVLYSWWSIEGSFVALEDSDGNKTVMNLKDVLQTGEIVETEDELALSANVKRLVRRKRG